MGENTAYLDWNETIRLVGEVDVRIRNRQHDFFRKRLTTEPTFRIIRVDVTDCHPNREFESAGLSHERKSMKIVDIETLVLTQFEWNSAKASGRSKVGWCRWGRFEEIVSRPIIEGAPPDLFEHFPRDCTHLGENLTLVGLQTSRMRPRKKLNGEHRRDSDGCKSVNELRHGGW